MQFVLHVTCSCICHTYVLSFQYIWYIWCCLGLFWLSFLSLPLFLFTLVLSMAPKRKSTPTRNPLRSSASLSFDLSPSHIWFCDDDAFKAFSENFSRWGIHSKCQVILLDFADTDLPFVIHSRGWESLCDVPVTCPLVLIQGFYSNMHRINRSVPLFFTRVRGTHIPIILQLVMNVLRVPSCERLRTVSRDELMSAFCERLSVWGEHLFTPCWAFAKGPRFINMVITFVLHPLSHYNSITEPRA